ncbi:30S ribosomal protein S3 [Candidatus Gracilibacteria bacterium]|nr:30S ribosomal protein S3 [Candidatus Gracilibacteria bacterium]
MNASDSDVSALQRSVWFATGRSYSKLLHQDLAIRKFITDEVRSAGLANIIIKRQVRRVEIILYVTKPGIVIGKGGSTINKLKDSLVKKFKLPKDLRLNIEEFKDPNRSAQVIAEELSFALKKNVPYRRLAKSYLEKIRYSGILGAKILIKGRLNKAEIARKEEFAFGSIPRHTIDASLDYAVVHCRTTAGILGIKVLLYKGDKIKNYTY